MIPSEPDPVKLVIGAIFRENEILDEACRLLEEEFGEIDFRSPRYPFDATDYYDAEMGGPLSREFLSFRNLVGPADLVRAKIRSRAIEETLSRDGKRRVNLDPGYLDYGKFLLASFKYGPHKIYLDRGVYADLALYYEKGDFIAYPWSFPDMKTRVYNDAFMKIRARYKDDLRRIRRSARLSRADD